MSDQKHRVSEFWNQASCGEALLLPATDRSGYAEQARRRYELEPYIPGFARFGETRDRKVLEIGVGLGADHQRFAEAGAELHGIDLTERAIEHVQRRMTAFGLTSSLELADAEALPFPDDTFDIVYSWGVLHHSPDTPKAFREVRRVLKRGGEARIMIYQTWSLIGLMLWFRYALLGLRPWMTMSQVYDRYLESPGTKAYSKSEARDALMAGFSDIRIETVLTHGDLLESEAGQRHRGPLLWLARRIWPRWLIRRVAPGMGLYMMIEGRKPQ